MAGFEVIGDLQEADLKKLPVSSLTASKGDLIERTAGSATWAKCTSTSDHFTPKAIVMEDITSASQVLAYRIKGDETVKAESANNANSAHYGDRMTLTDENTVNNTGSDVTGQAVSFVQEGYAGATTDKRLIGRILVGNGVDPDAS